MAYGGGCNKGYILSHHYICKSSEVNVHQNVNLKAFEMGVGWCIVYPEHGKYCGTNTLVLGSKHMCNGQALAVAKHNYVWQLPYLLIIEDWRVIVANIWDEKYDELSPHITRVDNSA